MDAHHLHPPPTEGPGLAVKVLGGTFHVARLHLNEQDTPEFVIELLRETPADRWFVMVSDDAEDTGDALAMIDDSLEVQIYAHGVLSHD